MKRFNYFVMSLISAAAFTFTACSSSDDLGGNSNKQEVAADGYYMTLTVKSPTSVGTRTAQQGVGKEEPGTDAESTITTGAIYLYNSAGICVFSKDVAAGDWVGDKAPTNKGTTKPFKVSINNVNVNETYNVYFVANASKADYANPLATDLLVNTVNAAENAKFLMFNQNDDSKKANHSTVTFKEEAKTADAAVSAEPIYLDRTVARIDAPNATTISKIEEKSNTTTTKNINIIDGVSFDGYALTNEAQSAYLMQKWTGENDKLTTLHIPGSMAYAKPNSYYGGLYLGENLEDFKKKEVNYVFENTTTNAADATGMYYKFTVKLNDKAGTTKDFEDGTFYRYNHKIYTSLKDLYAEANTEPWPFVKSDNSNYNVDEATKLMQDAVKGTEGATFTLAQIREKFHIEVYLAGATYYKYIINDKWYTAPTGYFSILRNSVYKLTVNHIYDLGKDVPNGPDVTEEYNYWMDVTVNVNPWVLNTIGVDLQ